MRRLSLAVLLVSCSSPSVQPQPGDAAPADADAAPSVHLAPELADEESLLELVDARLPVHRPERVSRMQSSVDRGRVGDAGVRMLRNGNKDFNEWICAKDAQLGNPLVPASFDLATCDEPYVRGAVAARFEGSGRMVRLWMTALSIRNGEADDEVLRVWVDDEPTPVVEVPLSRALGTADEIFAPPFGAGSPRFLAWRYPVVFAKKLVVAFDGLGDLDNVYHQTTVVLDREPRARARGSARLAARDAAKQALVSPERGDVVLVPDEPRTVAPKGEVALSITGPATIERLVLRGALDPSALRDVDLSVTWDGAGSPAIEVPLLELFGAALDRPEGESLALRAGADAIELALPMPFAADAQLRLINRGDAPATLTLGALGRREIAPGSLRLHVVRNDTSGASPAEHPLAKATGPGRLVGTCAFLEGHQLDGTDVLVEGLNFLEGDERIEVDGALAVPGTGTEDYFDSSFYFSMGPRATPFAQWWGVHEDRTARPWRGRASACRWHVANEAIDFETSLDAGLEVGPGEPSLRDRYRTLVFLYR